jgi:cell division protease FtsH
MLIDDEVRKIIEDAHTRAKNLLELNRKKLDDLAKRLLEKEVVYKSDLEEVLGKRTFTV